MKDNKKKVIVFIFVVILLIILVVLAIVFGKKKDEDELILEGSNNIVASLEATSQAEVDRIMEEDLKKNKFKLKDARIYINPYESSPLSAMIVFMSDEKTSVKVTIKGKHNDDIVLNYGEEIYHYIPVFALYEDYSNTIEIELGDGTKESLTLKTGKLDFTPNVTKNVVSESNGLYFITSPINMRSFAVDSYGEVRWYTDDTLYHDIVPLENGHILIGTAKFNTSGLCTSIQELDYLGRTYNTYNIEEGFLNDIFVKDDGNILLASKNKDRETYSDYIIEIDKTTGKIVKSWDVFKELEKIDAVFVNELDSNYFYNSGIEYDKDTDTLLLTYWGGEFVINLGYSDNSIRWIFSNPKNFSSAFSNLLLKGKEGFAYPKAMHSATIEGDTLKVFDNGYSTNRGETNSKNLVGSYSSANTYKISGKTISLVSTIDENKTLFSYALGDYDVSSGNDLVLFGRELKNLDFSSGINIHDHSDLASRLILKSSDKTIFDIEFDWASYSVVKIDVSGDYDFKFVDSKVYTTLLPSPKEPIDDAIIDAIKNANETVNYKFGFSNNIIEHNVLFMSSDEAKLVLIDDEKTGAIYTLKVRGESYSKKIVTDLTAGKYYVYILENGKLYKTDNVIEIS